MYVIAISGLPASLGAVNFTKQLIELAKKKKISSSLIAVNFTEEFAELAKKEKKNKEISISLINEPDNSETYEETLMGKINEARADQIVVILGNSLFRHEHIREKCDVKIFIQTPELINLADYINNLYISKPSLNQIEFNEAFKNFEQNIKPCCEELNKLAVHADMLFPQEFKATVVEFVLDAAIRSIKENKELEEELKKSPSTSFFG